MAPVEAPTIDRNINTSSTVKGKNGGGQGYRCWKVLAARQDGHRSSLLTASVFSENIRAEI